MKILRFTAFLLYRYYSTGRSTSDPYFRVLVAFSMMAFLHAVQILIIIGKAGYLFPDSRNGESDAGLVRFFIFFGSCFLLFPFLIRKSRIKEMEVDKAVIKRGNIFLVSYFLVSLAVLILLLVFKGKDKERIHIIPKEQMNRLIESSREDRIEQRRVEDTVRIVTVSYAGVSCPCPQWFESKFGDIPYLEGVERFYVEPVSKRRAPAFALWDGEHIPFTLRLTGRFSKEKAFPLLSSEKSANEPARIFWYDEICIEN